MARRLGRAGSPRRVPAWGGLAGGRGRPGTEPAILLQRWTRPELEPAAEARGSLCIAYLIQNAGNDLWEDTGPAVVIKNTVRGLQRAGHQVFVAKLDGRSVLRIDDIDRLGQARAMSLGLSGSRAFQLLESGVRRLQRRLRLSYYALFDSFRFYEVCLRVLSGNDICHEYGGAFGIGAALACWRLRIPRLVTVEADFLLEKAVSGSPLRGFHGWVAGQGARLSYRLAQGIITVSEAAKAQLAERWNLDPGKIVVMPNGVDVDLFRPDRDPAAVRAELGLGDDPVICFVGAFQVWHGLDKLLQGFARVLAARPRARLVLVGDGRARPMVERLAVEAGVSRSVVITGLVEQNRVPAFLAAADVAVLPYPKLGRELWFSPLKLYEYMAAGKAIVASRSGQNADVIRHGETGLLVEPGDVADLAEKIIHLLDRPQERRRLGENARTQAVARHSWGGYIQRLEAVYRRAISAAIAPD